jgi:hypothetical protein
MPREFSKAAQAIGQIELTADMDIGAWRLPPFLIISHIFEQ